MILHKKTKFKRLNYGKFFRYSLNSLHFDISSNLGQKIERIVENKKSGYKSLLRKLIVVYEDDFHPSF